MTDEEVLTPPPAEADAPPPADDEPPEDEEKQARSAFQARIDQLTREKYEARQRADQFEQELARHRQQATPPPAEFPTLASVGFDEQVFQQKVTQWYENKSKADAEASRLEYQKQQQDATDQQRMARLQASVTTFAEKHPDFWTKVNNPSLPPLVEVNNAAYHAIVDSDAAADIMYYLASNQDSIYRFSGMSPIQAIKEVARIEDRLARSKNIAAAHTGAPPPPSRLPGRSSAPKDPGKMTMAEYAKWRKG